MSTKYCVTKSEEEKKLHISLKYVLESCPLTPYIFIKRYIENWAFPELISKLI